MLTFTHQGAGRVDFFSSGSLVPPERLGHSWLHRLVYCLSEYETRGQSLGQNERKRETESHTIKRRASF